MSFARILIGLTSLIPGADTPEVLPPKGLSVSTSKFSRGLRRIYFNNNVLSLFMTNNFFGDQAMQGLRADGCGDYIIYGHRDDEFHDSWHKSKIDFETIHSHLVTKNNERLTPEEFKCVLDGIVGYERMFNKNFIGTENRTYEGQNDCVSLPAHSKLSLITKYDYDILIEKYNQFYHNDALSDADRKKLEIELQCGLAKVADKVTISYKETANSFIYAFLDTLKSHYLKPYLQYEKGYDKDAVTLGLNLINTALSALTLDISPLKALTAFAIRSTLMPKFKEAGFDLSAVENIVNQIARLIEVTSNPTLLCQLGVNYAFDNLGTQLAMKAIQHLPKIHPEDASEDIKDEVVHDADLPQGNSSSSTLTHRRPQ